MNTQAPERGSRVDKERIPEINMSLYYTYICIHTHPRTHAHTHTHTNTYIHAYVPQEAKKEFQMK